MTRGALFGIGVSTAVTEAETTIGHVAEADRLGLDLFTVSDHPYFADRLDAYSIVGFALGATSRISGLVSVTNLPSRPAPMLARSVSSLSALSGGRVVLGMGAGGLWDDIARLGVEKLTPGAAVAAFEEAVTLIRALTGGGRPVTFDGEHYRVTDLEPSPAPTPPIWTGSVGPKSLAATGRVADGWIPGHAADWLSSRYHQSRPVIDAAAVAAGRVPGDIATVYNMPGEITAKPRARTRGDDGRWIGGSAGQWAEELTGAVVEHGAAGFVYFPAGATPPGTALARWAGEVVPAVREALSAQK
ncbi:LLM class flavin-dependent oxidoreductase [Phytomonospora sp. NPDC050363]|uniref:LLM class flavin-dependent oxidoreductase n=1 Tax=Phytomonospora sp. NPDC050363 TaxID=3155642 RepID=UPI0033EF0354